MSTTSANMSLLIPETGDTDYPTSVTTSLTTLDTHTHASGSGVQIPTGGITDLAVTTAKLAANAVTTAKITDANVTRAKLEAVGQQLSGSVTQSQTALAVTDVAGLTVSITTTGRPVIIALVGTTTGGGCDVINNRTNPTVIDIPFVRFVRDATTIANFRLGTQINAFPATSFNVSYPVGGFLMIDAPAAGSYTYKVQTGSCDASSTVDFVGVQLMAYEL